MALTKEQKASLFDIMQECTTKDDISYVRQLLGLREKEIDALAPKGMGRSFPWS
jgi:hypothetical protein